MISPVTAFAPGRVNLIGEHTDYNRGLALPFAIGQGVTVIATPDGSDRITVSAVDLRARDAFPLAEPERVRGWRAFARGLAAELAASGHRLVGMRLQVTGSVPRGSGLSSSAALEVALALAMLGASGAVSEEPIGLARLCSKVENEWAGAQTGLLDQIASLCGRRDRALRIDFADLQVEPVVLRLAGHRLVTLDSGQRHANAPRGGEDQEGYNRRRAECARACRLLEIGSLREATPAMAATLSSPLDRRVRHVISENDRVRRTVAALSDGDLAAVGRLLYASHASLRDDYEISTAAVEATVERLRQAGAIGARIMGGGFGGHVLGLLPPDASVPSGAIEVAPGPGAHLFNRA